MPMHICTRRPAATHLTATCAVVVVLAGSVAVTPPARTASIALTADDYALFIGGTGMPTPSLGYADAATDLYLGRNGFTAAEDGSNLEVLTTPQEGSGDSYAQGAQILADRLGDDDLADKLVYVFGYSQGADLTLITDHDLGGSDDVHYVLVGDSANPAGGFLTMFHLLDMFNIPNIDGDPVPYESTADIYTLMYDGWADFPQYVLNLPATGNAIAGMFLNHLMYLGLDADRIDDAWILGSDGAATYHQIDGEMLPSLAWMLFFGGFGRALYDLSQPMMQVMVDLGYGHLDDVTGGDVTDYGAVVAHGWNVDPAAGDFYNPGDPVFANLGGPPISLDDIGEQLFAAFQLGLSSFLRDLGDLGFQGAGWYAAQELGDLVDAGLATESIDGWLADLVNGVLGIG